MLLLSAAVALGLFGCAPMGVTVDEEGDVGVVFHERSELKEAMLTTFYMWVTLNFLYGFALFLFYFMVEFFT